MAKRTIQKPRFYADIPSYLKTIGKYFGSNESNISGSNVGEEKVWNMNPYQVNSYNLNESATQAGIRFWINQLPASTSNQAYMEDPELHKLLSYVNAADGDHSTGWYGGILGHNLASLQSQTGYNISIGQRFIGTDTDNGNPHYANPNAFDEIVNFESGGTAAGWGVAKYDGYSLWEVTERGSNSDMFRFNMIDFTLINSDNNQVFGVTDDLKVGAYTCGIFFEPEHAFELSVTVTYDQEGIKKQKTVGGSTLTNINYLGVPNWGDQPAWTLQKTEGRDYTTVANRGRRQWKVGLSFLTDDGLFDKAGDSNKFHNTSFDSNGNEASHFYGASLFDTSLSSFFKLTHMGNLPFIFCPDSQADDLEFALCRITNKPSFKQVANNLFSTSLVLTETW